MASLMPRKNRSAAPKRSGIPLVVYFEDGLARKLEAVARERSVPKAALVRIAVGRLLIQLGSGQLELPLGVE
jgi:hypothetical protein